MSLEKQLFHLNENLALLVQKIHENTQAGNRIIQTLNRPAPSDEPSEQQLPEASSSTQATQMELFPSDNPAPASEPVKRKRRTKAELAAELEAQVKADPDSAVSAAREQAEANMSDEAFDPFADAPTDAAEAAYTLADVREAAVKFRDKHGLVEGRLLLAKYELGGVSELDPTQYAAFIKDCQR